MNLVDAIRAASKNPNEAAPPAVEVKTVVNKSETNTTQLPSETIPGASDVYEPQSVSPAVINSAGSVVRLELFLSPEQMHQMLRGILQGAHTVMTLRETTQHLRINANSLTELAQAGEIPAFMVDGQWKFPRQAVDEWITLKTLQTRSNEEKENAA